MSCPTSCAFHPQLTLTNFCRNPECMLPMCPKCVKIHSAEHKKYQTYGNFDNIRDLFEEISSEVKRTLSELV